MSSKKAKTSIHVISHENSSRALVIRWGPSRRVGMFGVDLVTGEITEGQWMKGRIYERRCDLSKDGKHVLYFGGNYKDYPGTYTVLSKYPYLRAIDFWVKGDGWNGGGLFLDENSYLLNQMFDHEEVSKKSNFKVIKGKHKDAKGSGCYGIYFPRLLRDGWTFIKSIDKDYQFELKGPKGYKIQKTCFFSDKFRDRNILFDKDERVVLDLIDDYMEFRTNKLYYSQDGRIFYLELDEEKELEPVLLADFTTYSYRAIKAPY